MCYLVPHSLLSMPKALKERQQERKNQNWQLMKPKWNKTWDATHSKFTAAAHCTRYGVALDSRQADRDSIEAKVNCSHNHNLYSDIHTTVTHWLYWGKFKILSDTFSKYKMKASMIFPLLMCGCHYYLFLLLSGHVAILFIHFSICCHQSNPAALYLPVGMLMVLLFPFLCFSISHSITQKLKWLKKKFKQPLITLSSFLLFEWDLNSVWAIGLISFRFSGYIISFDILTPLSWTIHTLWSILDMSVSLSPFMHLHDWSTNISYSFMLASTNSNLIFIFTLPSHINRAYIKNPKFYLFLVCVLLVKWALLK